MQIKKIIDFLKNLFSKSTDTKSEQFSLGAILNEIDNRDIPYPSISTAITPFAPTITVFNFLTTNRFFQGNLGVCVPYCLEFIQRATDGIIHSRRIPYAITRKELGWTENEPQGLPQREAAKTFTIVGAPKDSGIDSVDITHKLYTSLSITDDMRNQAALYRFGGFAFPVITIDGFKQALTDGKMIAVTIAIDWSAIDPDGTVHPVKKELAGYHEVAIGMSDDGSGKFRFANWWGEQWGTNGDGFIEYSELEQVVFDALSLVALTDAQKAVAKSTQYIFNTDLKPGTISSSIGQLQKRLAMYGVFTGKIDNNYGPMTLQAVKDFQKFEGLSQDGKVGPQTRAALNVSGVLGLSISKLDLWCAAAKQMEGALPYRNNPGNLRYVGQQYAVNDGGFCKFDTYAHGYTALRNLFIRACSGLSSEYNANGNLYDFYEKYAPASDKNNPREYAEFVAKYIGVPVDIIIKTLLN